MTEQSPLEVIFFAALEKGTPEERARYLDAACSDDNNLRQRVERLLAAHPGVGRFLEPEVGAAEAATVSPREKSPVDPRRAETMSCETPQEEVEARIAGRYKLVESLGQGGMGAVFMAQQTQPVKRVVAIKLIKLGMDSKQVLARFEAERQALALMDHPNIAKVLDAGTTDSGRPFFVMELVKGVPITRFCDERQLSPRERLELFIPVCNAIQHAHQKGIIHRDIKPTNVLVALYDDRPVPKVIDFGVAKATGQQLTDASLMTGFGGIVGTPEYMSPEQAQLNQLDIDTRSDVYGLGVLLYELLTGTTPIDRKRLGQGALFEVLRIIREEEPTRPSTRLSTSDALASIAATRATEPGKLTKLMRGELDWIVMKCLEKDRSRRYPTANGLAHDLERYLADEPVEACPPGSTYRLRKLAGKYKKALVIAAAFVVLLAGAAATSTLLAVRATTAEKEANRQRIASDEAKQEALHAEQSALDAKAEAVRQRVDANKQRDEARITAYASGMQLAQRAWEENNVVRARELLEQVPEEAAGRKLRGFEWDYLSRLCHSEAMTLKGHSNIVMSVAFNPDGQRLASASLDKTVKIWDSATGKKLFTINHADSVDCVAFSPDGRRLASGSRDGIARIWDCATGKEVFALKGHSEIVSSVAFSPNGQRLASTGGDLRIWDAATGKQLSSFNAAGGSVAFSPDGQRVASLSNDFTVKIFDISNGKELFVMKGHSQPVSCVAFSPDGRRLASTGWDRLLKIWESDTGKELVSLRGADVALSVSFSPDGLRLALASWDKTVKILDSTSGKELFSLKGHSDHVMSVAFPPGGERLASGSEDGTVKIWDCTSGKEEFDFNKANNWGFGSVAFSPDGQRVASGSHRDVIATVWDIATGREVLSLKGTPIFKSLAFSPDGRRLATVGEGKTVKIWDGATGRELFSLEGRKNLITSAAFSPDGQRLVTGDENKMVKIWDGATGKELLALNGHGGEVESVAFSPDGRSVASGGYDKMVKLWDSMTGKELLSLKGHGAIVRSIAFSPDGHRLSSGGNDRTVKIWDRASGREVLSLKGHGAAVMSVAFSPDGQRLASGSLDRTIKIWDGTTGKELFTFKSQEYAFVGVAFSPDGTRLAAADSGSNIHLWETTSVSPENERDRGTTQMVAKLFGELVLRVDVLERLRSLPGLNPMRKREAIILAEKYPAEPPWAVSDLAWDLVTKPGGEAAAYRKALHLSEIACQSEPQNGRFLTVFGVACYRVGDYQKALAALLRSAQLNKTLILGGPNPADLAFLTMTQQQLGHHKEAQAGLEQLRERMREPVSWTDVPKGFLREAEALLAKPKMPAGKQSAAVRP